MRIRGLLVAMILFLGISFASGASESRILLVGDSWADFIKGMITTALRNRGLSQYVEANSSLTAVGGSTAESWAADTDFPLDGYANTSGRELITMALSAAPDVDVIHISLGGNDFLWGAANNSAHPTTEGEWDAFYQGIVDDIAVVTNHILSLRPKAHLAICGYDYLNLALWPSPLGSGLTTDELRQRLVDLGEAIKDWTLTQDNVVYVHNFGLMQYTYGIPGIYDPGEVSYPGNAPGYVPFPGGDVAYPSPAEAMGGGIDPIHLSSEGYAVMIERCLDQYYVAWLEAPEVSSIAAVGPFNPVGSDQVQFQVTFNKAVTGVDATDFVVTSSGIVGASVVDVKGSGSSYLVTVDTGTGDGTLRLDVVDDDTILYAGQYPLAGPGAGDGDFTEGAVFQIDRSLPLPVAAWPVSIVLLLAGYGAVRRRHARCA